MSVKDRLNDFKDQYLKIDVMGRDDSYYGSLKEIHSDFIVVENLTILVDKIISFRIYKPVQRDISHGPY